MPPKPLQFGQYYHIYNRGNNRENIFVQARNYPYFLKLYAKHIEPVAETFAYCLLPNHFHVAIRTYTEAEQEARVVKFLKFDNSQTKPKIYPPSRAFKNLFIAYTRAFNKAMTRTGTLFERPFKRKLIDSDTYFMALIRYIHRNPQNHNLVQDFREWDWSSYHTLLATKATRLQRETVLEWHTDRRQFITAHLQEAEENFIQALREDDWL